MPDRTDSHRQRRLAMGARINTAQADAHNNAGTILVRQGKLEAAAEHFAAAVRLKPDYAEAYNHWGIAAAKLGRFDEAKQHFEDALRLKPDLMSARTNLDHLRARAAAELPGNGSQ
jgi:Flp pilus assembly protein TadD